MKILTFVSFIILAVLFGIAAYIWCSPILGYLSGVCTVVGAVTISKNDNI